MTAPSVTLLPCPFCGATGETLIRGFRYPEGSSQKEGAVWCPTCDCKGSEKAWNTRATPTPSELRERVARIIDPDAFSREWKPLSGKVDRNMALAKADAILALLPDEAAIRSIPPHLYWLIGKGRTRPDEPIYGAQLIDAGSGRVVGEGEGDTLEIAIAAAIRSAGGEL